MIVTGSQPPYKDVPRVLREPSSTSMLRLKSTVNRSGTNISNTSVEKFVKRQRPNKSTPLKISEKILENLNVNQTGLTFTRPKCRRNLKVMEGSFSNKGMYFTIVQPGYLMTKRKSGIKVTLNMEELCANGAKEKRKTSVQDERDMLIKSLHQEIDNLNRTLAETGVSNRSQFKQFVENTKIDIEVMLQEHRDHIKSIEEDNKEEMEKLIEMYEAKLNARGAEADLEAARMQEEMDSVLETLESCKEDVAAEMEEEWLKQKKQLESEYELKTEELLAQQRLKLKSLKIVEINNLNENHALEVDKLKEQQHKEMNTLLEKFAVCAADAENLKIVLFEAEKLKEEVADLRDVCARTKQQLRKTQNELADAKVKLQGYELSFSEKVAEVEERYSMKIQGLMLNNTDIRRNYMKKCAQLLDVQTKNDAVQEINTNRAKSTMKTIILARAKADISLVSHENENDKGKPTSTRKSRPRSAPIIKQTAEDNTFLSVLDVQTTFPRPYSSLA